MLFYLSAVNREGQSAPRTGFFHFFQRKEASYYRIHGDVVVRFFPQVLVKQWDPVVEDLRNEELSAEATERIRGSKLRVLSRIGLWSMHARHSICNAASSDTYLIVSLGPRPSFIVSLGLVSLGPRPSFIVDFWRAWFGTPRGGRIEVELT
jgi:hypothetical protein